MKRAILAFIALLAALAHPAGAQFFTTFGGGGPTPPPPPSFICGDIIPTADLFACFGTRALTSAVASGHGQLLQVSRADGDICDLLSATDGTLGDTGNCTPSGDNGTLAATWCLAASPCHLTIWYDQIFGSGHNLTHFVGAAPVLTFNAVGTRACLAFNQAAVTTFAPVFPGAPAAPVSETYVAYPFGPTGISNPNQFVISTGNVNNEAGFNLYPDLISFPGNFGLFNGVDLATSASYPINTLYANGASFPGGGGDQIWVNGSNALTGNSGSNPPGAAILIGGGAGGGSSFAFIGYICEAEMYQELAASPTQFTNVYANQHDWYTH